MKDRDLSDKCHFCVTTVRALTLRNVTAQVSGIRILLRCVPDDNLNQYTSIASQSSQPSQSTFMPTYDADGNQTLVKTKTGIWQVTYNAENRPVKWTCGTTNLVMAFDRMGRRVLSEVQVNDAPIKTETYVYDGYTCILRKTTIHTNSTPTVVRDTFVWDPTEPVATRPLVWQREGSETAFYFHDGNKNVSDVVSASGEVLAHYTYAPFGDSSATGSLAESNPWRFSSEYADDEIGCVYYNFRHYEPMMGRWLSRDNVGEWLRQKDCYLLCQNSSIYFVDRLGLLVYPQFGANRGDGLSVFDLIRLYLEILNDVKKCLSVYNRAIERRDRGCNDKFNHCVTSCELGYNCGSKIAYLAGVEKELRDLFFGDVEYAVEFWGLFFGFAEDDVRGCC